jgi:hypothetical protein
LLHFELILVHGKRQGSSFSLLHVDIHFPQHHFLKWLTILQHIFLAACQKSAGFSYMGLFLDPLFCRSTHLFLCWYHAVFVIVAL